MIDPRTIYPLGTEIIANSVKKTGRCVVVHEEPRTGGMGAKITARGTEEAFLYLEARSNDCLGKRMYGLQTSDPRWVTNYDLGRDNNYRRQDVDFTL